ncbi:MAG: DegT/DnrJ/EryC1/StrS aminotransferase family protein, partial [bacterium]
MRTTFLPFHQSYINEEEINEVVDTLRSGWITTGPKTKKFEQKIKNYIGCDYAIALNSCTAGLHLSLVALGIKPGDEVITSPITFPATANVIEHQGAKPVFVDIEPKTLNLDVNQLEEKITPKTKAIMPVHFAGHPCEMDRILELAKKYNLYVIEDAAHATESCYKDRKIGTIGDCTSFSFYATKNITTGEGGVLTTNNKELAEKIELLSLHGISKDAWKRYSNSGYKHWELVYPGYKYNMFDIQASLGLHQLDKIDEFWEKRKRYTQMYNEAFKDVKGIKTLNVINDYISKHAYHLYVIIIKIEELKTTRDLIMDEIQKQNIGVGIHFRG